MKKEKKDTYLVINNEKYKVITPSTIQSNNKFIYIEEVKNSGVFKILSSYLHISPDLIQSISLQHKDNEQENNVIFTMDNGEHQTLNITKIVKLNIGKSRFMYIEEYDEGVRLTFTKSFIDNINDTTFIEVQK